MCWYTAWDVTACALEIGVGRSTPGARTCKGRPGQFTVMDPDVRSWPVVPRDVWRWVWMGKDNRQDRTVQALAFSTGEGQSAPP